MKKKTKSLTILIAMLFCLLPAIVLAWPVPETGQTKYYNNAGEISCPQPGKPFYGQDASYSINPMSYTKLNASGNELPDNAPSWVMVRDNVTGLIWENKQNMDGAPNYSDPHDADNTYTWYDSNPATNDGNAGISGNGISTFDTEKFIRSLNVANYGGHNDWRLPTIKELDSIVNNYISPFPGPRISTVYFPSTRVSWYWSSDADATNTDNARAVNFDDGYVYYRTKSYSGYVRAVRGGQNQSAYVDNGNGTVTDTSTGLTWQQATAPGAYTWQEALAYCENLDLAGYTDWRLPSKKELRSLVDYSHYNPVVNTAYFPDTTASWYWSSTTNETNPYLAWIIEFAGGYGPNTYKDSSHGHRNVRAVRGGQSGSLGHMVLSSPKQASIWDNVGTMPITWNTQGLGANVKISLSRQGGLAGSFVPIIASTPNNGRYDWPITGPASVNCVVKIEQADNASNWAMQGLFVINEIPVFGTLQFSDATYSVNKRGGSATITVTRIGGHDGAVGVHYATSDGTATDGIDYTATSGDLSWADKDSASKTFIVSIANDSAYEGSRTINLELSNPTGEASLGSQNTAVLTIIDDDQPVFGTLQFSDATYSVNENVGTAMITVTRAGGSDGAVGVHYATSNGTATDGNDYTATSGDLIWADKDSASKTFTVIIIDDSAYEGSETINLELSNPTGDGSLGSQNTAVLTIIDDDPPVFGTLQFGDATYSVNENGGTATITVTRTGGSDGAVGVHYATSNGTATDGSDYMAASGDLSWADKDSASKTFTVSIANDSAYEGSRTINLELSNPTGDASLGSQNTAVLTIIDDDPPIFGTLHFSDATYSVSENDGMATITVTRTGGRDGAVGVHYATSNGTATGGNDYTAASGDLSWADKDSAGKTFTVNITNDSVYEGNRTINLELSSPTGDASLGSQNTAVLTIIDDDPPVLGTLQFGDATYSVSENGGIATITVTRTGGSDGAVGVHYATSNGTATDGNDYAATSGDLSWADKDSASKTFTVSIINDSAYEGNRTVVLILSNPTGGASLGVMRAAVLTIIDNETPIVGPLFLLLGK